MQNFVKRTAAGVLALGLSLSAAAVPAWAAGTNQDGEGTLSTAFTFTYRNDPTYTVVIPDAELKIFLTASNESRAKRRHLEYIQKGQEVTYEEILQDILRRDQQDSSRAAAPLRKADDAVLIDSTNLTFEQTVDAIKKLIVQRAAALSLSI